MRRPIPVSRTREKRTIGVLTSLTGVWSCSVALPSLSSWLRSSCLFDAAEVDLPRKGFRDEVERVNFLLHLNISYLQRMLRNQKVIIRCNEVLPVYSNIQN